MLHFLSLTLSALLQLVSGLKSSLQLQWAIAYSWCENMLGYLSFQRSSSFPTVGFEERMMSKDKYPSIFSRQMEVIVVVILKMFFATHAILQIGKHRSDVSQF